MLSRRSLFGLPLALGGYTFAKPENVQLTAAKISKCELFELHRTINLLASRAADEIGEKHRLQQFIARNDWFPKWQDRPING